MNTLLTIIGTVITVISAALAFCQYRKNVKIEQLRIFEALLLHKLSAQALGAIQGNNHYNKMLENISGEGTIKKIIYDIGLNEGYCQSIFIETAKMFCSLKNVSIQEIDNMISNEHLSKEYRNVYVSFAKMERHKTQNKIRNH
jgi:hypothetical protein